MLIISMTSVAWGHSTNNTCTPTLWFKTFGLFFISGPFLGLIDARIYALCGYHRAEKCVLMISLGQKSQLELHNHCNY